MRTKGQPDVPRQSASRRNANSVHNVCSVHGRCVSCSLMRVVQYRFSAFRKAFDRDPLPYEPLFFDENCAAPEQAEADRVIEQLTQAAKATGVELIPLLRFLGLR